MGFTEPGAKSPFSANEYWLYTLSRRPPIQPVDGSLAHPRLKTPLKKQSTNIFSTLLCTMPLGLKSPRKASALRSVTQTACVPGQTTNIYQSFLNKAISRPTNKPLVIVIRLSEERKNFRAPMLLQPGGALHCLQGCSATFKVEEHQEVYNIPSPRPTWHPFRRNYLRFGPPRYS